jgi:pimeloyl-ACP methyl ester carboxylesterase
VQNAGHVVSKEELLRVVWPNTFIEEGSLTRTISILRKALDHGSDEEYITTLPKRGYRFSVDVNQPPDIPGQVSKLLPGQKQPGNTPAESGAGHKLVECDFKLTENICRKLNRATLDPLIIGDHLRFVDNQVQSNVLVFFMHGLGLDHRDFEPVLTRLPYRGVSPTLYGCEPERRGRISLSLADHVVILRELLRDLVQSLQPATVLLVGFSMGADMGFELLLRQAEEHGPPVDAFLALECNLCLDTCTISRVLADFAPEQPAISLSDLRKLGESAASLEQWLNVHEYLVRVLRKFEGDIGVLRRAAADIVAPFCETRGFEVFGRWFRGVMSSVRVLRLVFPQDSVSVPALARLRLENLDRGFLGVEFPENVIRVSPKSDHFQLMASEELLRQVGELVTESQALAAPSCHPPSP